MTDLIEILESFNRKERFFLIAQALGCSNSGEPAFSLSGSFRKQLNKIFKLTNIDVAIPEEPAMVFVAMDYHLDWLQAALTLAHSQDEKSKFCNEGKEGQVIEGTQRDVDLLVAFKDGETFHLILVEAKAYSDWTNDQLSSKAARLRTIFGEDGKKWNDVQPYFCVMSPKESERLNRGPLLSGPLPKWMLDNKGELQWLPLQLPKSKRRVVSRYDKHKKGNDYRKFEIRTVVSIKEILAYLNEACVRCTFGAVGYAIGGVPAQSVGKHLGERRKEASWVVNAGTGEPTGYTDAQKHPCLKKSRDIIGSGPELLKCMGEHKGS